MSESPSVTHSPVAPTRYRMRAWLMVVLGILLLVGSVLQLLHWKAEKPQRKPRVPVVSLPFVQTMPVSLGSHRVIVESGGFVNAKTTAQLSAQVSGKIVRVSPKLLVGERVEKGETLVQLGITDYQVALSNAKANLISAQSAYQQEQGRARQAKRDTKRLGVKATALSTREPQLSAAKAAVENAKAQIELAETNLARTTIRAPFSAAIISNNAALGEIASGGSVLANLVGTDAFTVKLAINALELPLLSVGDAVILTDKTYGKQRSGVISRLDAMFDAQNRTVGAYVDVAHPLDGQQPLLLNDYVTARIAGKTIADSAWIPNSAIAENRFVWEKLADDTIKPVNIAVIYRGSEKTLVTFTQPIKALIIRPKDTFSVGQTVTTSAAIDMPENQPRRRKP